MKISGRIGPETLTAWLLGGGLFLGCNGGAPSAPLLAPPSAPQPDVPADAAGLPPSPAPSGGPSQGTPPPPPPASEPAIPWAVSRHTWPTDDRNGVAADLGRIAELGAKFVRTDFWWYAIEPTENSFDAGALDYYKWFVDTAASKGLGVVVNLSHGAPWAGSLHASDPTLFLTRYQQYASRVAALVGDKVKYYQIWNEPNHEDRVTGIADIVVAGRAGIAEHDTDFATMVNMMADGHDLAVPPNWESDFEGLLVGGGMDALDILGLDHYPGTWAVGDWGGNILDRLFALGKKWGKQVAILETGYSTAGCLSHSEGGQTSWIDDQLPKIHQKVVDLQKSQGVRFVMANWFKLDDPNTSANPCDVESHFGIYHTDRTLKPGYNELKKQIAAF